MKYTDMVILMVKFKIDSIDRRMFGFVLGIIYGIKLGIIERTDIDSSIDSSERSKNNKLDGSLDYIFSKTELHTPILIVYLLEFNRDKKMELYWDLQLDPKYVKLDGGVYVEAKMLVIWVL